jgi:hypothetical protein
MSDVHHIPNETYWELQRRFGGRFVARRGAEVVVSAERFDWLIDALSEVGVDRLSLLIEYVEPADRASSRCRRRSLQGD